MIDSLGWLTATHYIIEVKIKKSLQKQLY